jgi:hypothetical protein
MSEKEIAEYVLIVGAVIGVVLLIYMFFLVRVITGSGRSSSEEASIRSALIEVESALSDDRKSNMSELDKLEFDLAFLERRAKGWADLNTNNNVQRRNQLFIAYNQVELRIWAEERISNGIIETKAKIAELELEK